MGAKFGPAAGRARKVSTRRGAASVLLAVAVAIAVVVVVATIGPIGVSSAAGAANTELVVDDDAVVTSGDWAISTALPGYSGNDYAWSAPARSSGPATARWDLDVTVGGTYGVYYRSPDGNADRASNAPFTVHSAEGNTTYGVDERIATQGKWVLLGNRRFDAGTSGFVELSNDADGYVDADAIKLGAPAQVPIDVQIDRAVRARSAVATIEPGNYRRSSALDLSGLDGVTVDARGATLTMTTASPAITASSNDLTLLGLRVTYDPLPYTQGRVTALASDGETMDVQLANGYPSRFGARTRLYDADTARYKSWTPDSHPSWAPGTARTVRSDALPGASVGDVVVYQWTDTEAPAISVDGARDTLRDITLDAAPGMGIMNAAGYGGTVLDDVRIVPAPAPPGASDPPVQSTNLDATQFQSVQHGPTITNCTIENSGDDVSSIVGIGSMMIGAASGSAVTLTSAGSGNRSPALVQVGDRLARWLDGPSAIVTRASASAAGWSFELDRPVPTSWTVGAEVTDLDRRGSGFTYRNNHFSGPGRVLIKTSHGSILDNDLRVPVVLAPETSGRSHGYTGGHIDIRGNTFRDPFARAPEQYDSDQVGALSIDGWNPYGVFSYPDLTVADNTFETIRGVNLMIKGGSDVVVSGNTFVDVLSAAPGDTGGSRGYPINTVVFVTLSDKVTLTSNTIVGLIPAGGTAAVVWPDASGLVGLPAGLLEGQ
jgi:hypothetical protein